MVRVELPFNTLLRSFRMPVRGIPVDFSGREIFFKSRITNISKNGVFIKTKSPYKKNTLIYITFKLPNTPKAVFGKCIVRWSTASHPHEKSVPYDIHGMGLEFLRLSRTHRKTIVNYISEFLIKMRSR